MSNLLTFVFQNKDGEINNILISYYPDNQDILYGDLTSRHLYLKSWKVQFHTGELKLIRDRSDQDIQPKKMKLFPSPSQTEVIFAYVL